MTTTHDDDLQGDDAAVSEPHDHGMPPQEANADEQIKKLTEAVARAQAELQNAKIRMERESKEIRLHALGSFLLGLLPTIDNFRRAFQHLPEDLKNHEWVKGITAIEQDLMKHLTAAGLTRMECLGQEVDPEKHDVLMEGPGKLDTVMDVLEDGYELHGKVLRPAKVKAGNGESA